MSVVDVHHLIHPFPIICVRRDQANTSCADNTRYRCDDVIVKNDTKTQTLRRRTINVADCSDLSGRYEYILSLLLTVSPFPSRKLRPFSPRQYKPHLVLQGRCGSPMRRTFFDSTLFLFPCNFRNVIFFFPHHIIFSARVKCAPSGSLARIFNKRIRKTGIYGFTSHDALLPTRISIRRILFLFFVFFFGKPYFDSNRSYISDYFTYRRRAYTDFRPLTSYDCRGTTAWQWTRFSRNRKPAMSKDDIILYCSY